MFFSPHLTTAAAYLAQANHWLDAMTGAYQLPPSEVRLALLANGSLNCLFYGDDIWMRYDVAGWQSFPATAGNPFTADLSKLRQRGAVFLACGNTMAAHALELASRHQGVPREQVLAHLDNGLVVGAEKVPAGVAELTRLQARGYGLVFVPKLP